MEPRLWIAVALYLDRKSSNQLAKSVVLPLAISSVAIGWLLNRNFTLCVQVLLCSLNEFLTEQVIFELVEF